MDSNVSCYPLRVMCSRSALGHGVIFLLLMSVLSVAHRLLADDQLILHTGTLNGDSLPTVKDKSRNFFTPDNIILQTAGYVGFVAIGGSWDTARDNKFSLLAGYLPDSIGGIELWQLTTKFDWYFFSQRHIGASESEIRWRPFYAGVGVTYGIHKQLWASLPDRYPADFYYPTAFRLLLNFGTSFKLKGFDIFVGYSLFDIEAFAYVDSHEFFRDNYRFYGLAGVGSLSFAIESSWLCWRYFW